MSCYLTDFDLQFPKQDAPITDFVHILGMSSLKQFTTCFLMKGDISGSGGTLSAMLCLGVTMNCLSITTTSFSCSLEVK